MKKKRPVPTFKSIPEEAEFWDTHDSTDYAWEEAKDVKFAKNLQSVYIGVLPIRVDEHIQKAVEKIARRRHLKVPTMAGKLLQERLQQLQAL
ncbi:MAG: CopG family antitoxin [bacterium]|nr:CopG family antitoxin [bacterium]